MYLKVFVLLLFSLNCLRVCVSTDSESLEAINSACSKLEQSIGNIKKKEKNSTVCYDELGCFQRLGPFKHLARLPESPEKINTRFIVYNRQTKSGFELKPNVSQSLSVVAPKRTLVIIIHGFGNDSNKTELIALKDSVLQYANVPNVIMVDWAKGAGSLRYTQAAVNTELVGRQIANLVNELRKQRAVNPYYVHLIGYSLGAHVAHFAGQYTITKYSRKIGRITALDAAGPLFQGYEGSHLNKSDANFVDTIHTSGGRFILSGQVGFTSPLGHIDFYPNGGTGQPRCQKSSFFDFCDHCSSIFYMEASLRAKSKCSMVAYKCDSWEQFSSGNCTEGTDKAIMGYSSDLSKSRGNHFLKTTEKFPFCLIKKKTKKSKSKRKFNKNSLNK